MSSGGSKLYELRKRAGKSQNDVEGEALLGEGYLHRLESGKVSNPKRETLERILTMLNARYNEQYEILRLFGYQVATPLPTEQEIEWAISVSEEHLQRCPYPAYLLDCAYRLCAWNDYIPMLIGQTSDSLKMKQFKGKSVVEVILDEQYGLTKLADNPNEIFSSVLLTYKAALSVYWDEEWSYEMTANLMRLPLFKKYWDLTEQYHQSLNRPTHPPALFRINIPGRDRMQFRVLSFPFSQDRRFLIVEYVPLTVAEIAGTAPER
jgi:transcriptional regulator with XRE-family HTH domain